MKKLSFLIILLSLLYFQSCDTVIDTVCNPACNDWEECKKVEDAYGDESYECSSKQYRCTAQSDCEYPQRCDTRTNWCLGNCTTPCEAWERCNINNQCQAIEDYCSDDTSCLSEKSVCNQRTHKCDYQCQTECENWQYCDQDHQCKADEERNFCDETTLCETGKTCNTALHKCEYDNCNPQCESWQVCTKDGECETSPERCDPKEGCERNTQTSETCNPTNHLCEKDPGVCAPICALWQTCNINNECVAADGYCELNDDCENGKRCDTNHICVPISGATCESQNDCESWEYCEDGRCKLEQDSCNLMDDCNGDAVCNFSNHKCEVICDSVCEYWENCSDSGQSCILNEDDFCLGDSSCSNGQVCNIQTHKCENDCEDNCEPWGNCEANGECSVDNGYCDATDDCGTTYGFSATCDLTTHTCKEDPSDACDPFCEAWEQCNANNQCELVSDRCETNTECGTNEYCSRITHICKDEPSNGCNPGCESWQFCDEGDICRNIEGTCINTSECQGTDICKNNECQDPDPTGCSNQCDGWEVCVNDACLLRDDRCENSENCKNGKSCNTTSHLCEYTNCTINCQDWETCDNGECKEDNSRCTENSDCPNGLFCNDLSHLCTEEEYCDGSNDCGTTYGFSATCDLITHTCKEDPSDACDPFCETWEVCNSNNECELADYRCLRNTDCGVGNYCSRLTHTCKEEPSNGCDPGCEYWQFCDEGNICTNIEGTCTSINDCDGTDICKDKECQDPDPNGCTPSCNGWEVCVNNSCQTRDERCVSNENCENQETCDEVSHLCENSNCSISCQEWEICDGNNCISNEGRCNGGGDCPVNKYCDLESHSCKLNNNGEICNQICEDWERCQSGVCITNEYFCNENNDCIDGERCSEEHKCVGELPNGCSEDIDCEGWQVCSSSKQCIADEDHCSSNSSCKAIEECNPSTHICEVTCNPICESWQTCSDDGACVNQDGSCTNDSDCGSNQECKDNHKCKQSCTPGCEEYEICNYEGQCEAFPGLCSNDDDCLDGKFCDESHSCSIKCEPSCDEWEECIESADGSTCTLSQGRCSDKEYIEGLTLENYGCGYNDETMNISCNLYTHTCVEDQGHCDTPCEAWEECTLDNECVPKIKKCNSNTDCNNQLVCDIETHDCVSDGTVRVCETNTDCNGWEHCSEDGVCLLDVNACADDSDCINGRWCDTEVHECIKNADECFPQCSDWEECFRGNCIAKEDEHRCNMKDYCGPYSLCSSSTHQCENISDSCNSTCNPWEVCLETGCSLIFGTCNSDLDCGFNKVCNSSTHICDYKSCTVDSNCNSALDTADKVCKKEEGETTGICLQINIQDVREHHGYNKNTLNFTQIQDYIEGEILAIYKDSNQRQIGFYMYISPNKASSDTGSGYFRTCNCDETNNYCQETSDSNIALCPLTNYLYRGLYVSFLEEEYDIVKDYKIGNSMAGYVKYINYYGMSTARAMKQGFIRSNKYCEYGTEDADILCQEGWYCSSDNICKNSNEFDPYLYNIRISQIFSNNDNKAEAFESSLVNAVDNKPYTVIENSSFSNHNRTKLKDSYDEEFYIDKELTTNYSLSKGTGQCINNKCKKESWTSCNKYCKYGFKVIQEDTDKDTRGDTCQNTDDADNDGKINSVDNCPYNYNPLQTDRDNDNKGDACDPDLDGDGWVNEDDNCPTVSNADQEYTSTCSDSVDLPANASFDDGNATGNVTRNSDGSWNEITGCDWSCNEGYSGTRCDQCKTGYHLDNNKCVIDEVCEEDTCTETNKTECKVVGGFALCFCDDGYHAVANQCIIDEVCDETSCTEDHKSVCSVVNGVTQCACDANYELDNSDNCVLVNKTFSSTSVTPPPRTGTWGNACNYSGDKDWDGHSDIDDNCPNTFNPDQNDYDEDGIGDYCDPDIDGDNFLNNEDNCVYYSNPILCKICECNDAPVHKYDCTSDNACTNIDVRGINSGPGKCHYYETTLRTLKGVLKYEHQTPASRKSCITNSDCSSEGGTCQLFNDSELGGGLCTSGNKSDNGLYIIMPRSSNDLSKCHDENCTR